MALSKTDDTECYVNVTGQQWWWEIDYPVQDGCGERRIATPIVTSGQLVIPVDTNVLLRGTSRDVIHSFWVPRINGKRDVVPGRIQTLRLEADQPGHLRRPVRRVLRPVARQHADGDRRPLRGRLRRHGWTTSSRRTRHRSPGPQAAEGEAVFIQQCARCHQVNGLVNADGDPQIAHPEDQVYSGAAPNLTHLMSRNTFAGATFDLLTQECRDELWNASPRGVRPMYLAGVTEECFNPVDLREWIRNAPEKKPMYADQTELGATGGLYRGMPFLGLSEDQIDDVIAYLLERSDGSD